MTNSKSELEDLSSAMVNKNQAISSSHSELLMMASLNALNINVQSKTSQKSIAMMRNGTSVNSSSFTMKNVSAPAHFVQQAASSDEIVEIDLEIGEEESKAVEKRLSLEFQHGCTAESALPNNNFIVDTDS